MVLEPDSYLRDRYRIIAELTQGGMGSLYRGFDENLGIYVAVKENLYLSNEYARQFQQEAKILASLKHEALPRVIDYFLIPNQGQYLIMDFIEGEDLRQRIDRLGKIEDKDLVLIGTTICDALSYLHSRTPPVIHRDIKPGNIKITPEGQVILIDFGLAKVVQGNQQTITGARAMTPGYSPPEQYGTAHTDERSDIYSLGATLYAALTGIIPEDALSRATGKLDLTPVHQLHPEANPKLAAVIEKSLSVDPDQRYQSIKEMKTDMAASVGMSSLGWERPTISIDEATEIPPPPPPPDSIKRIPSQPAAPMPPIQPPSAFNRLALPGLLVLLVLSMVYFLFIRTKPAALPPTETTVIQTAGSETPMPTATHTPEPTLTPSPEPTLEETSESTEAVVLASPTPAATPYGGSTGLITFVSNRTGTNQLWTMNADGSNQRQLSAVLGGVCQPAWSPDHTKIAVISPCDSQQIIYKNSKILILDENGANGVPMPHTQLGDFDPAWSPDGKQIAFTSHRTGLSHIFLYDFEEDTLQELSDTRYPDMHPAWNASGKQIAFTRLNIFFHIYIMSSTGQTQFQFSSNGNINDYWPTWSSDGRFVLFSRNELDVNIPYIVRLDYEDRGRGTEARIPPLSSNIPRPHYNGDLSHDMQWMVYESWPDGRNHDIYIIQPDGSNWLRLTTDPAMDFEPVWK